MPGLEGQVHPSYPPYDLDIPDNQRIDVWLKEFREFEKNGDLPRLNIIRLGNDHTVGTRPACPTPRAMVAENDLALGRLVEAISNSTLLEGLRDLRPGGRRAERARSRRRAPLRRTRRQPLHEAAGGRQHALHDVGHAAHDGADSRPAADEPVRRGGDADVRRVSATPFSRR